MEESLLTGFLEKIVIVANKPFMVQEMVHPHNSGSTARSFFKLLRTEKCQQVDDGNNNGLCQNKFVQGK